MPPPDRLATTYATDEEVLLTDGADFATVCPRAFLFAQGSDGVFAAGDPWTLTSASEDFEAQGVAPNMVVQLSGNQPRWKGMGGLLAVESASGGSLLLRVAGNAVGEGKPPGPPGGATGVGFVVTSLRAPIEAATFELNEAFGVRRPEDVYDPRVFRLLCIYRVLWKQYTNMNRARDGDFAAKAGLYAQLYRDALAAATVRWGPQGEAQEPTRLGSTRVYR